MKYCADGLQEIDGNFTKLAFRETFVETIKKYSLQFSLPIIEDVIMDEKFKCTEIVDSYGRKLMPILTNFLRISIAAIQTNPARQRQIINFLKLFVRNVVVTERRRIGLFDLEQLEEQLPALLAEPEVLDSVVVRIAECYDYEKDEGLLRAKPVAFAIQEGISSIRDEFIARIDRVKDAIVYPTGGSANHLNGTILDYFESVSKQNSITVANKLRHSQLDRTKVSLFFKNYQARCIALLTPYFELLDLLIKEAKETPTETLVAGEVDGQHVMLHSLPGELRDQQIKAFRKINQLQIDVNNIINQNNFLYKPDARVMLSFLVAKPVYQSRILNEYNPELLALYAHYESGQNPLAVEEALKGRDLNSMTVKQSLVDLMAAEAAERERQRQAEIERAEQERREAEEREREEARVREEAGVREAAERQRLAEIERIEQVRLAAQARQREEQRAGAPLRPYAAARVDVAVAPRYVAPVPVPVPVPIIARVVAQLEAPELFRVIEERLKLIKAFRYYYGREASGYTEAEDIMTYGTSLPCRKIEVVPMFKATEVAMDGHVINFDFSQFRDKPPFLEEWRDNMQAVLVKKFNDIKIPISVALNERDQERLR